MSRLLDIVAASDLWFSETEPSMHVPIPGGEIRRIEPCRMSELLMQAGAPKPWEHPEKCITVVGRPVPEATRTPKKVRKAQDALNQLRRLLPTVIDHEEKRLEHDLGFAVALIENRPDSAHANQAVIEISEELTERAENLQKLQVLLSAANDAPSLIRHEMKDWHKPANWLAAYYRGVVGKITVSADGPAVRFIDATLKELGWGAMITPAAIAKAIRPSEKIEGGRKFLDTASDSQ